MPSSNKSSSAKEKTQAFTRIDKEEKAKLTALSYYRRTHDKEPSSESAIMAEAISEYLERHKDEWSEVFQDNPMDMA